MKVDHQAHQQTYPKSTNEHKMTRKHRSRNRRFTANIFQSGYCAGCHIPYINLEEHIHSKRHLKLIGDDFISIRSFDSFLELEAEDLGNLFLRNSVTYGTKCKVEFDNYSLVGVIKV